MVEDTGQLMQISLFLEQSACPQAEVGEQYEARDLARDAGLRYVYTGNVIEREHQHTHCPGCKQRIIARNGYELGEYRIAGGCCG